MQKRETNETRGNTKITKNSSENNIVSNAKNNTEINAFNSNHEQTESIITSGEKSVYLEWLKNPSNTLYNAPFELKLDKNIDTKLLKDCILKTIYNNKNMCAKYSLENNEITKIYVEEPLYDVKINNVFGKRLFINKG